MGVDNIPKNPPAKNQPLTALADGGHLLKQTSQNDDTQGLSIYREIGVSSNYNLRVERVLSQMKARGLNLKKHGTINYGGQFIDGFALAAVDLDNKMGIGSAGGLQDLEMELILAHEYRHLIQQEKLWQKVAKRHHLDPDSCNLKCASTKGSPKYQKALRNYLRENEKNFTASRPYIEIDAYVFSYNHYKKFVEADMTMAERYTFLAGIKWGIQHYQKLIGESRSEKPEERRILRKSKKILKEIDAKIAQLKNPARAKRVAAQSAKYLNELNNTYSGTLLFDDGTELNMQDRFLYLQAGMNMLSDLHNFAEAASKVDGRASSRFERMSKEAEQHVGELNNLLNRQTFRFSEHYLSPLSHGIEYRNDDFHTLDGVKRAQGFWEFASGSEKEVDKDVKAGSDFGVYWPLSDHFMFKVAPALYAGFQTGINNLNVGLRLDNELHLDIPITQRIGLSLFAGYYLGAQLGIKGRDAYDEARLGLEIVNF